jgi:hypothetical protein
MIPSLPEIFFFGIVFYLLYKFLFNFFLPIFKTTKAFKEQFRNMHDQTGPFQQQQGAPQKAGYNTGNNGQSKKPDPMRSPNTMGEYIDFEEIK